MTRNSNAYFSSARKVLEDYLKNFLGTSFVFFSVCSPKIIKKKSNNKSFRPSLKT